MALSARIKSGELPILRAGRVDDDSHRGGEEWGFRCNRCRDSVPECASPLALLNRLVDTKAPEDWRTPGRYRDCRALRVLCVRQTSKNSFPAPPPLCIFPPI